MFAYQRVCEHIAIVAGILSNTDRKEGKSEVGWEIGRSGVFFWMLKLSKGTVQNSDYHVESMPRGLG